MSDQLLIAAGRIPNSDTLDLEKTGVRIGEKGYIVTDRFLETDVNGIFALFFSLIACSCMKIV